MVQLLTLLLALQPIAAWASVAAQPVVATGGRRTPPPTCSVDASLLAGLTNEEASIASWLASEEMGQSHLLDGWAEAAVEDKRRLLEQVVAMDERYPEDAAGMAGLTAYVAHARVLLAEAAADKNPFEGYTVEIPEGETMEIGSESFRADEQAGMAAMSQAVFVLVAGGLGERLGYDGIKVELPTETLTCSSFLETYITSLLAMQRRGSDTEAPVPLVIMTSEDTHEKTVALLEASDYFGMPKEQVHFISQSNVPAIEDNAAKFALEKKDAFSLQTKPHGHGDVRPHPSPNPNPNPKPAHSHGYVHAHAHAKLKRSRLRRACAAPAHAPAHAPPQPVWPGMYMPIAHRLFSHSRTRSPLSSPLSSQVHTLLHTSGLLPKFAAEGRKHLVFFQDTNVLAFKAIPAALGCSLRRDLAMNSLTVPRSPTEAAGAICKLVRQGESPLVINVEYNQLEALLTASGLGGDTADATGYSPYPGNVNTFILALGPYASALQATGGSMPEFVNPKYANAEKTQFKKPTRLECMMQDFPKLLGPEAKVGFTSFERWFAFSPVKNSIPEALKAAEKGVYAASPGAGEAAVFDANARLLRLAGVDLAPPAPPAEFLELPLALSPSIALTPNFALTVDEVMRRTPGADSVKVSARSTLLLDGDVVLHSLDLDGALSVRAVPGATVHVRGCTVVNAGWPFVPVEPGSAPKGVSIRGYTVDRSAVAEVYAPEPGEYELSGAGELRKLE